MAQLDGNGLAGSPVSLLPFDEYKWWYYDVAIGPHRPWCVLATVPWEERHTVDWSTLTHRVFPCDDFTSISSFEGFGGWFEFLDDQAVMITEDLGEVTIHWIQSGLSREVFRVDGPEFFQEIPGSILHISRAGLSLTMLWTKPSKIAGSGGYWSNHNFVSILHGEMETTETFSVENYGPAGEQDVLFNYSLPLGIGSDGLSRLFVPFLEDKEPKFEPGRDDYLPYSVETVPKVRAYKAASLDSVAEWILGYDNIRLPHVPRGRHGWGPAELIFDYDKLGGLPTYVAVTNNHRNVGFAISREGVLDLWVLVGQSWYGPYPITSNISGAADIAVDASGRYWLVWDDDDDVYAAVVTPGDLGLETASTAVAPPISSGPSTPMLGQNSPNPFNARTAIELRIPAEYMTLDIFNLGGQRVYSTEISRGTTRTTWDGTNQEGSPVASGVYLYRLRDDYRTWEVKRMLLIR